MSPRVLLILFPHHIHRYFWTVPIHVSGLNKFLRTIHFRDREQSTKVLHYSASYHRIRLQSSLRIEMSFPNEYPKEYQFYGYNENPANNYSYDNHASRILPHYDQPPHRTKLYLICMGTPRKQSLYTPLAIA